MNMIVYEAVDYRSNNCTDKYEIKGIVDQITGIEKSDKR